MAAREPSKLQLDLAFEEIGDSLDASHVMPPVFVEVAAECGLDFRHYSDSQAGEMNLPETFGAGIACFDFDLDGYCDLFIPNGCEIGDSTHSPQINDAVFRNHGRKLQNVSRLSCITGFDYSHGCSFGDINNDGFEDVVVANLGRCQIFVNQGDGTFLEHCPAVIESNQSWWMAIAFVDLDGDQDSDLICVPYVNWTSEAPLGQSELGPIYTGPHDFEARSFAAFRNEANGEWTDATIEWGFTKKAKGLAIAVVDLDHDLKSEIYVANDAEANQLFTRSHNLSFDTRLTSAARYSAAASSSNTTTFWREIGEYAGASADVSGQDGASMSATVADFDLNGFPDLLVTNYLGRANSIYGNHGRLNFRDNTLVSRMDALGKDYLSFGACPVDYDLDGDSDLVIANGHVLGPNYPVHKQNAQILNCIDGSFIDVTSIAGPFFANKTLGRSVSTIDFDNDGDTDLLLTHCDEPVSLLENRTFKHNHWVSIEISDWRNRPIDGARIEVLSSDGRKSVLPVVIGGSYLSDSQRQWTVGLGPKLSDVSVMRLEAKVYWPDGAIDHWTDLASNDRYRVLPGRLQRLGDRSFD